MSSVWKMMLLANSKDKDKSNFERSRPEYSHGEYDDDNTGYGKRDYYKEYANNSKNRKELHHFDRKTASEWVDSMENEDGTEGEHWTYDQTESVRKQHGFECDGAEFYAAINMMYSDYYKVAKDYNLNNTDFYAKMANAFLCDKDSADRKLVKYYECVVE